MKKKNRKPVQRESPMASGDAARTSAGPAERTRFPIVGVGASAGGLEAFRQLLKHLPLDTGMGFILVQHLDPEHESALTQILSRATSLPVHEVTNQQTVEANHVYIIPPDTDLSIAAGVLMLQPRTRGRTPHRPIDTFFESLAQDQREGAIGVVLSGTASDGTLGLEAIKAEGGITFAQDDSAKHDSMPRSAIAAGCVDLVLAPSDIAKELARIAKHPYGAGQPLPISMRAEEDRAAATEHEDEQTPLPSGGSGTPGTSTSQLRAAGGNGSKIGAETASRVQEGYKKILLLLRNHCGVDFSLYKSSTIQRRITRRLVLNRQDTLENYAHFLRGNGKELDALYSDVLISVTSFFRNPEAFDILKREVLPKLIKQRGEEPLRCWVLGCSTGQEAYSIAMTFIEVVEKSSRIRKLQIFATDLNEALLDKARHGLYAKSLATDISPQRLRKFFAEEEGGYRISKMLRDMVVFARQNLIADPPFSRMDLISCRNLLIYLEPSLQQKALPTFHYALKPGGFLLLGGSESVGSFTDLFEAVDKKHKIYAKKPAATPALHLPIMSARGAELMGGRAPRAARRTARSESLEGARDGLGAQREADRITVNQFAPPGVLVNDALQILQFRGPTSAYLRPAVGKASFDVLKMARDGLLLPLRAAINQARKHGKSARKENVPLRQNGASQNVNLEVIPLKNLRERGFLILFTEAQKPADAPGGAPSAQAVKPAPRSLRQESRRIAELEEDLSETRDYVQSIQEQYEAANEELQAANEEVQSANEELQSVNEELETSKEELESSNEELTTLNEEMSSRNVELSHANNDLVNLQNSAKLAVVLVGRDLSIRHFSPQAKKLLDLLGADVGRSIGQVRHTLVFSEAGVDPLLDLEDLCAEVVASVREQEREVRDKRGCWYQLRVRPYMTLDNKVEGAVLVLMDIDTLKRSEQETKSKEATLQQINAQLRDSERRFRAMIDALPAAVYTTDAGGRLVHFNPVAAALSGTPPLGTDQWHLSWKLYSADGMPLPHDEYPMTIALKEFRDVHGEQIILERPDKVRRWLELYATLLRDDQGQVVGGINMLMDVTERRRADETRALLAEIVASSDDAIISEDLNSIITTWNKGARGIFGYTAEEVIGKPMTILSPPDRLEEARRILERIRRGETIVHYETVRQRKDGSLLNVSLTVSPIRDASGRIIGAAKIARDITERNRVEEQLRQSAAKLTESDHRKSEFLAILAHELRNPLAPLSHGLQILRLSGANPQAVKSMTDLMKRQVDHLVGLVDDLLDMNRINQGKIELHRATIELAPVVTDALDTARPLSERRKHELTVTLPKEPIFVNADPLRLAQVVGNLLNNACKFTEQGGHIRLDIEGKGEEAVIRVRDNGIGIASDQLPLVFNLFMQGDVSMERSVSGLGIGLALVKTLVEMHDGTVEAHSAGMGHGSEFVVRLPIVFQAPLLQPTKPPVDKPIIAPRRILVVDDNRDGAESLALLLQMSGHETRIAHDGLEAMEIASQVRPDLILLDIGLPKMDGYEVARRIRAEPWGKNLMLVALTGWGHEEDRQKSRAAGFDIHIVKPVDPDALTGMLTELSPTR